MNKKAITQIQSILIIAIIGIAAIAGVAYYVTLPGEEPTPTPTPTATPTTTPTPTATPTPTPIEGFPFSVGTEEWLEASIWGWGANPTWEAQIYERLVDYDFEAKEFLPKLATEWEVNEELTQWDFTLRQGVTFHDGTPFNAEAVKFTFDTVMVEPLGNLEGFSMFIQSVEILNTYKIRINTDPVNFLNFLAAPAGFWMVGPSIADLAGTTNVIEISDFMNEGHEMGTGPYTIDESVPFDPNEAAKLVKYEDYWGGWETNQVDEIFFQVVPGGISDIDQLVLAGSLDATTTPSIALANVASFIGNPDFNLYFWPSLATDIIMFNTQKYPTNITLVRQALAAATPVDEIIDTVLFGYGTRIHVPIAPGTVGDDPTIIGPSFNMTRAQELLTEAGFPNGLDTTFTVYYWDNAPWLGDAAEVIRPYWRELGVELEVSSPPWGTLMDIVQGWPTFDPTGELVHHAFLTDWSISFDSSQPNMQDLFGYEEWFNFAYWYNEEYDDFVSQAFMAEPFDIALAKENYRQASEILFEEMPGISMFTMEAALAISKEWTGHTVRPADWGTLYAYELRHVD